MSFGGSIQGMVTTLKNNSSLIHKRIKYFDINGSTKYLRKKTNFKKATPDQLKIIREQIKLENRKTLYLNHVFIRIFFLSYYST